MVKRNLSQLLRKYDLDVILLQETKFMKTREDLLALLNLEDHYDLVLSSSLGLSGGLACIWNSKQLACTKQWITRSWIGISFVSKFSSTFNLANIYGPHKTDGKIQVWEQLSHW